METTLELLPTMTATNQLSLRERQAATLAALDAFMEQDETEHRETLSLLRKALEEDRPGQRRVFGEEGSPQ
jgi:hypothetical protein